jgi:hypothetical protein
MPRNSQQLGTRRGGLSLKKKLDDVYSEAVLRIPRKPAIELMDARTLSFHSLFALLTTIGMSFAAAIWTAFATSQLNWWLLTAAIMLTVLSLLFLALAIVAWCRMHSRKHNIEVPLSDIGDVSRIVRETYLGPSANSV